MRLNRVNLDREEEEKEDDDTKEEKEEEDEVEDEEKGQTKDENEQEEKEGEDEEKEGDDNEEDEYEDNHKKNMVENSGYQKERNKKKIKMPNLKNIKEIQNNKPLLKIIIRIALILIAFIIVLRVIIAIVRKIKKKNEKFGETSEEAKILQSMDSERFNKIKEYLINQYSSNGEININKFQEESVSQKEYKVDNAGLTEIHVSISLSDNCTKEVITHLSSLLYHMSTSSFLHLHIMNLGNFTLETFTQLINMVQKTNNRTQIVVYNAQQILTDFKIREDKLSKFSKEYARLYAFKAIKGVPKLIMLNLDNLLVEKDLAELYQIDMNDIYARGLTEVPNLRYKLDWMDNYLYDKSHYINCDVLLVNLELCRKDDLYTKAHELNNIDFYKKVEDPVQDILNVVMKKKIEFIHPKFNKISFYENPEDKNDESKYYPWFAEAMKYSEKYNHFYSKEDLLAGDTDPFIINYLYESELGKKPKKYEEEKESYMKMNGFN